MVTSWTIVSCKSQLSRSKEVETAIQSIFALDRYLLLLSLLWFQLNTGPDCFVGEGDSSVWEDSIWVLQRELTNQRCPIRIILRPLQCVAYNVRRLLAYNLRSAWQIIERKRCSWNAKKRSMRSLNKHRIILIPSIIDLCQEIYVAVFSKIFSDDAVTIWIFRIFVNPVKLVGILFPNIPIRKSERLLIIG